MGLLMNVRRAKKIEKSIFKENPSPQQKQEQENKPTSTLTLESIDKRLKRIEFTLYGKENQ